MTRPRRALLRGVTTIATGTLIGQLINVAASPLITRLYSPEQFGIQGVVIMIVAIGTPLVSLSLPMAIVIAPTRAEGFVVGRASTVLSTGVAVFIGIVLLGFRQNINSLLGLPEASWVLLLIPLALWLTSQQLIWNHHVIREELYKVSSLSTVVQSTLTNILKIGLGAIHPSSFLLAGTASISPLFRTVSLRAGYSRSAPKSAAAKPKSRPLRQVVSQYRDFPILRTPSDVLAAVSHAAPVLVISALYGTEIAGLYTIALNLLNVPATVMSNAIGEVLYGRFSKLNLSGKPLRKDLVTSTCYLLAITIPLLSLVAFLAPRLFGFVFGSDWSDAGQFATIMCIWIPLQISSTPAVKMIAVLRQQHILLYVSMGNVLARLIALAIPALLNGSALVVVFSFSFVCAIGYGATIMLTIVKTGVSDHNLGKSIE